MNTTRIRVYAAMLACLAGVQVAAAQTPANITSAQGNGQSICAGVFCNNQFFSQLVVLVTDANGNPVPNATVNWTLNNANTGASLNATSTLTGADGTAANYLNPSSSIFASQFQLPVQYSITAQASGGTNPSVTFTETQAFTNQGSGQIQFDTTQLPIIGTTINGTAGGQGFTLNGQKQTSFRVKVYYGGGVLPGVSVRLVSNQSSPSVACATGAGADPGSVLTDSTGTATCTPVFGPGTGFGTFYFLIGGIAPQDITNPLGLTYPTPPLAINMQVAPGVPTALTVVSGNNQSANAGQSVAVPLVVSVSGQSGPLSGQTVNWTVSPAGAATLSSSSSTTGSNGQASTNVVLASTAAGPVTITAKLANSSIAAATFTITAVPLVSVTALQYISGNSQTALQNVAFSSPLIVQVNGSNGQPLSGVPVAFTVSSGTATLSSNSVTTGSNGQASVNVTAGGTVGNVTVTATVGTYTQTFNLTISPPGPALSTATFMNGADFQVNSLSPCSIATIMASGLAPSLSGTNAASMVGALPYSLGTDTVTISGAQAPIYNVANVNGQQQLTFQVPCSVQPGSNPITVAVGAGSATATVNINPASPGVFETAMSDGVTRAVMVRPDGSFVSTSNPARRGEHIIVYATGLGPTTPSVGTNSLPIPGVPANTNYPVIVGVNNAGVSVDYARLSEDLIGVYVVSFQVPTDTATGNNVTFSIGVAPQGSGTVYYSYGTSMPIQ